MHTVASCGLWWSLAIIIECAGTLRRIPNIPRSIGIDRIYHIHYEAPIFGVESRAGGQF